MKQEEANTHNPQPEPFLPDTLSGTLQPPSFVSCPYLGTLLVQRQEVTKVCVLLTLLLHYFCWQCKVNRLYKSCFIFFHFLRRNFGADFFAIVLQFGAPNDLFVMKKLLQLNLPKKHVCSRWTKQTTESILRFLNSFVTIARGSVLSHSADRCLALKGPRILKCEECLFEFSGLYDRYLKLFIHYKTDHTLKCNMLIGRKWTKHKASLDIMVQAWKMDLNYELKNLSFPCISESLGIRSFENLGQKSRSSC